MDAARDQVSSIQPNTHSFVVKVWLADPAPVAGRIAWRGRITHVPSGRTHHFVKLSEIAVYVAPYLEQLGVRRTLKWKLRRWLRR